MKARASDLPHAVSVLALPGGGLVAKLGRAERPTRPSRLFTEKHSPLFWVVGVTWTRVEEDRNWASSTSETWIGPFGAILSSLLCMFYVCRNETGDVLAAPGGKNLRRLLQSNQDNPSCILRILTPYKPGEGNM